MNSIDIGLLATIISVILAVAGFLVGRLSAAKTDGKQDGVILTEIGYIKSGVDDLKKQMRDSDDRFMSLSERVASVEASAKQAHKRLDDHLGTRERSEA